MLSLCIYVVLASMAVRVRCSETTEEPVLTRLTEPVIHGEGPHWHPAENVLYYVDITGETLHRYDPVTKTDKSLKLDKPVGVAVPIKDEKNKFLVGLGRDFAVLTCDWESGTHSVDVLASVDPDDPRNRFNDGKADARGRVWAGTMGHEEPMGHVTPNKGSLFRLDNDPEVPCQAVTEAHPVNISNGLAWSHDNRVLYYIDTPTRRIDAFDFDLEKGDISNRRTVFEFGELPGSPDGMTIDDDGKLWVACWGGSRVIQVDPEQGLLLRNVTLPTSMVTSVAWGGTDVHTLYVTTMKLGLTPSQQRQQPHAGSVWSVTNLGTKGTLQHQAVEGCKHSQ